MDRRDGRRAVGDPRADRRPRRSAARTVVLLLALVVVAAAAVPLGVAAQSASIAISVDGTPVEAGGETTVTVDPTVGFEVSADSAIESVIVRVNGDTLATYEPNASTLERSLDVELVDGENEVSVVVQTADGVSSQRVTVLKDDQAPFVRFTSPFETGHYRQIVPNTTKVNQSNPKIAGELHDLSDITRITVTRRYQYSHANKQYQSNARWDIEDPSDSFTQQIFLGVGTNEVSVLVVDEFDQSREYTTQVNVTDTQAPDVRFDLEDTVHGSTLELDGAVTDNGQLDTISAKVEGYGSVNGLFNGVDKEPDESATRVPLSGTLKLQPGENTVVVTATDVAGNTVEVNHTVVYTHSVAPNIRLFEDSTTVEAGNTVHLEGVVEDGEVTAVTIDAVDADSGDVVDLARVYTGPEQTGTVTIEESLDLADGRTRIVVRATDTNDDEHQASFLVDATGAIVWEEPEEDDPGTGNESDGGDASAGNESSTGGADGGSAPATTTAPPADGGMMSALPLPGFTGVTAAIALAVVAVLGLVARRRSG